MWKHGNPETSPTPSETTLKFTNFRWENLFDDKVHNTEVLDWLLTPLETEYLTPEILQHSLLFSTTSTESYFDYNSHPMSNNSSSNNILLIPIRKCGDYMLCLHYGDTPPPFISRIRQVNEPYLIRTAVRIQNQCHSSFNLQWLPSGSHEDSSSQLNSNQLSSSSRGCEVKTEAKEQKESVDFSGSEKELAISVALYEELILITITRWNEMESDTEMLLFERCAGYESAQALGKCLLNTKVNEKHDCMFCIERKMPCECPNPLRNRMLNNTLSVRGNSWMDWVLHESMVRSEKNSGQLNMTMLDGKTGSLMLNAKKFTKNRLFVTSSKMNVMLRRCVCRIMGNLCNSLLYNSTTSTNNWVVQRPQSKRFLLAQDASLVKEENKEEENMESSDRKKRKNAVEDGQELVNLVNSKKRMKKNRALRETEEGNAQHQQQKVEQAEFRCGECGVVFSRKGNLQRHRELMHLSKREFICDFDNECGKTFQLRQHLDVHIQIVHHQKREFCCKQCSRSFSTLSNLRKHLKSLQHTQSVSLSLTSSTHHH